MEGEPRRRFSYGLRKDCRPEPIDPRVSRAVVVERELHHRSHKKNRCLVPESGMVKRLYCKSMNQEERTVKHQSASCTNGREGNLEDRRERNLLLA